MNRLIRCAISFVLPFFCLLISVSYAEFSTTPINTKISYSSCSNITKYVESYSIRDIYNIANNYVKNLDNEDYKNTYFSIVTSLRENNRHIVTYKNSDGETLIILYRDPYSFGVVTDGYTQTIRSAITKSTADTSNSAIYLVTSDSYYRYTSGTITADNYGYLPFGLYDNCKLIHSSDNIKALYYSGGMCWDGETYYYEVPSDKPDEPVMPSNSEIASVVQSFYDSDLYKNNTNFKDFMVVYSFVTGYYSIIGTDNHLLQEIYYDGAKPSNDDFTYPETWWRFYNYFGNVQNFFYGWDYWLYSTRKENDVFLPLEYNGVGKINDLFNLKFTNQSVIVYSSYEYEVYEFRPPTEEGGENQVTNTTVPGNEFTYDENLDPTDSNYSPIQNYIPANPSQTILGNVDFDEINKTFEENKDILNIEGASWLFTANNKLVGYFIGFLSLLIVFLIISRILGG